MDVSSFLRETSSGVEVDVVASPGSTRSEVQGLDPWRKRMVVKVRAPPEKGEANEELESLLTLFFGARAEVVRGHASRMKTVAVSASRVEASRRMEVLHARP